MFPVEDPALRDRLVNEILTLMLSDNVKASRLLPDGSYERLKPPPDGDAVRSQQRFMELARASSGGSVLPRHPAAGFLARPAAAPRGATRADLAS